MFCYALLVFSYENLSNNQFWRRPGPRPGPGPGPRVSVRMRSVCQNPSVETLTIFWKVTPTGPRSKTHVLAYILVRRPCVASTMVTNRSSLNLFARLAFAEQATKNMLQTNDKIQISVGMCKKFNVTVCCTSALNICFYEIGGWWTKLNEKPSKFRGGAFWNRCSTQHKSIQKS